MHVQLIKTLNVFKRSQLLVKAKRVSNLSGLYVHAWL